MSLLFAMILLDVKVWRACQREIKTLLIEGAILEALFN